MDFLPVFLNIKNTSCLVVGGGEIAARKVRLLLRAGAQVSVVSPELNETLAELRDAGNIRHRAAPFQDRDLTGMALAIAATDDTAINQRVSELARQRGIPVNVVDHPELCSFVLPSIIDRSPVIAAISTGGASPVLARLLRARLETLIPASYGRLADMAGRFRDQVKQRLRNTAERRRFWEKVFQGPIAELVYTGRDDEASAALQAALDNTDETAALARGEVYLVGAGPGDPDLLTFRALRLMQQADVVLYDRLVTPAILDLVRREAERIYVGKKRAFHTLRQEEINQELVRLAKQGKRVLRLKGGDPFIFGRGGEEIETLAEEGIQFQIVPGITAASGCASYAGIPLTHRDYAQSVVFVTGHLKDGTMDLNWANLTQPQQTVVIYMGLTGLDILCRELIHHGLPAATPIALIQQGTTPQQRVLTGTLETLPGIVATTEVHAPTLLIVGEVVRLHGKLGWFQGDIA
ncbi:MAG: uroporphyrinogen-III C-methyltransferase [Gammaproteobacteria bacterium]|nr:uroporphyrinogen-III C-methyltransferase [Gammaproteobacteria bacterium]